MSNYSSLVTTIIQDAMIGAPPKKEVVLLLGDTPKYLVEHADFPPLPIVITGSVIEKACFDHGIPTSFLKRLPSVLEHPKSLFKSASIHVKGAAVVLTIEVHQSSPIIIPVHPNKQMGRGKFYNVVASVYAKEGPDPELKWTRDGLLLWQSS
ncbi:MuF-C-terminal domain-containing protein [Marinomonas dokdonensis]|uniref:MuF-C-terminal domain-containing protein n=1 Tax=Marinomonas dokdonensis TaxID=328224 RepID=UPI0040555080